MTTTAALLPGGSELRARAWSFAKTHALRGAVVLASAFLTTRAVLRTTGGEPAVPLDDAFIHFGYARAFWEGRGFAFTAGSSPAAGATSLLWPLLLALPYGAGLRGEHIIWAAWAFGWLALGMLGYETRRASERLLSSDGALAAELMVLGFGGHLWFAASGMEVVPLAWLLMRAARRGAEWLELPVESRALARELVVLAWLGPLLRPEGLVATLAVTVVLAIRARGRRRAFAAVALAGAALPPLIYWVGTGSRTTTTALVKWLPLSPYYASPVRLCDAVLGNVRLLFGTLLNGEIWSAVFLPQGSAALLWLAVPALIGLGFVRGARARALLVAAVAAGILIPTTYDSFLWNRLRYLWPFAAAWFVGVAAVADAVGLLAARIDPALERVRLLVSGVALGGMLSHVGWTLDDLATSANAIRNQQAALGHWAARALPSDALIGVNDTGAIGYLSERRLFDVVGLTTAGEARYWAAGTGSRLEHYEHLDRSRLPTTFIVYPEWFGLPALLGEYRTERRVTGATILGGETMVAYSADYSRLGSGARPTSPPHDDSLLVDELDIADLESEAAHGYRLFDAVALDDIAVENDGVLDGGRRNRTREAFEMGLVPGGRLVARLASTDEAEVSVRVRGAALGAWKLATATWQEVDVAVPPGAAGPRVTIAIDANAPFTALHYWSYRPSP